MSLMLRSLQANFAYRFGFTRLPYAPLLISLEPTNYCNLRCPMCPVGHRAHDPSIARGFMPRAVFDTLLPELARIRPVIAFHMGGESLMHPDFFQMGQELRTAGLRVRLDSNAMLISRDVARRLIEHPPVDEIYLDLDGDDAGSYERIRKRANFDRVVGNIRHLLSFRAERKQSLPRIIVKGIRYYRLGAKPGFPDSYKALFADAPPDEYRFAWADYWPGSHREDLSSASAEDGALYQVPPANSDPKACELLWSRLAIGWDGQALLCCLDLNRTALIADVVKSGIMGAWNSPAMMDARRAHISGRQTEMSLCANCQQIRRESPSLLRRFKLLNTGRNASQGGERQS
ncbi:radical SAM/SPASM domain-containing protein [Roseibium marinum]|uniref:Iron-sulfur cluster protein n=1 Tax=Roseibium marinum TaxID=281252 RepID=A0A2S3UJW8_9HYPH|nr:radical SAM/SPASM domain-containing protein [Roseibium marinum]POF27789.1 iron-sulfur cluster protein [Roseibium marinum]